MDILEIDDPEHFAFSNEDNKDEIGMIAYAKDK